MEQSILKSTKKLLSIGPDDDSFNDDVMTHINTAFSILNDAGIGPDEGFVINDDSTEWEEFLPDDNIKLSKVKTYVQLRARMLFDPPTSSFLLTSMQEQIKEVEWRLNVNRETTDWVDPDPPVVVQESSV